MVDERSLSATGPPSSSAAAPACSAELKADYAARMETATRRLLDQLAAARVAATFYVVGEIARTHPKLVRDIHAAGHEVGSHSWDHRRVHRFTPKGFRDDARASKDAMEQASREAMPKVPMIASEWLTAEDDYYHQTTATFELGRHKPAYVFPVLRVRYADADETWLYFTPSLGQMVKFDSRDRANRWWYYSLHAMD